jgi:hypothetical protein
MRIAPVAPPIPVQNPVRRTEMVAVGDAGPADKSETLPGRMSVGASPVETPRQPDAQVRVPEVETVPRPSHRIVHAQPAPVARSPVPAANKKRRLSRTFVELSRSAP